MLCKLCSSVAYCISNLLPQMAAVILSLRDLWMQEETQYSIFSATEVNVKSCSRVVRRCKLRAVVLLGRCRTLSRGPALLCSALVCCYHDRPIIAADAHAAHNFTTLHEISALWVRITCCMQGESIHSGAEIDLSRDSTQLPSPFSCSHL